MFDDTQEQLFLCLHYATGTAGIVFSGRLAGGPTIHPLSIIPLFREI